MSGRPISGGPIKNERGRQKLVENNVPYKVPINKVIENAKGPGYRLPQNYGKKIPTPVQESERSNVNDNSVLKDKVLKYLSEVLDLNTTIEYKIRVVTVALLLYPNIYLEKGNRADPDVYISIIHALILSKNGKNMGIRSTLIPTHCLYTYDLKNAIRLILRNFFNDEKFHNDVVKFITNNIANNKDDYEYIPNHYAYDYILHPAILNVSNKLEEEDSFQQKTLNNIDKYIFELLNPSAPKDKEFLSEKMQLKNIYSDCDKQHMDGLFLYLYEITFFKLFFLETDKRIKDITQHFYSTPQDMRLIIYGESSDYMILNKNVFFIIFVNVCKNYFYSNENGQQYNPFINELFYSITILNSGHELFSDFLRICNFLVVEKKFLMKI